MGIALCPHLVVLVYDVEMCILEMLKNPITNMNYFFGFDIKQIFTFLVYCVRF